MNKKFLGMILPLLAMTIIGGMVFGSQIMSTHNMDKPMDKTNPHLLDTGDEFFVYFCPESMSEPSSKCVKIIRDGVSKQNLCESHDGKWDERFNYCDNVDLFSCGLMEGSWIDCRPCSAQGGYCASVCVSTCELE